MHRAPPTTPFRHDGPAVPGSAVPSVRSGSRWMRRITGVVVGTAVALQMALAPAAAQQRSGRGLPVVRDAETEQLMRDYTRPIFKVAGIPAGSTEVVLLNRKEFNAFVADGRRIFVNVGVILDSRTPNEVIGVLAHETGHLAGGHLIRQRDAIAQAQIIAAIGMLLGAGALVGAAASGNGAIGQGGIGVAGVGGGVAQRTLLSYQRGEEMAADQAAVTYLNKTQQSAKGMLVTFQRFANEQLIASQYTDPYAQSHPMARDRIAQLEVLAAKSPYFDKTDPAALQARHDLVRAKLDAYVNNPQSVAQRYPASDSSLPARYARAIVAHRLGDTQGAQRQFDALTSAQPGNPWFWEAKGETLIEGGRPKDAVGPLRKAVSLAPWSGLTRVTLGYALVASGDRALLPEAVRELNRGLEDEPDNGLGWRQLAVAQAQLGNLPEADLATARGLMSAGDIENARKYAARARDKLPTGSPAWLRASDIVNQAPPRRKTGRG